MATWLDQVNNIRSMAAVLPIPSPGVGLPPVTEDRVLSDACRQLAKYEVENLSGLSHLDDQGGHPNFTAGQNSNIWGSSGGLDPDVDIINQWGLSVFHGLSMLDPRLERVGFGSYSTTDPNRPLKAVAALNILQGVKGAVPPPPDSHSGAWYSSEPWPGPVVFPAPIGPISAHANMYAFETPDARASTQCSYTGPAGLPISVQVGAGGVSETRDSWLKYSDPSKPRQPDTSVEVCIIDQNNFTNSDPKWQNAGRQILRYRGAVVVLPRQPLSVGQYRVHIQVSTQPQRSPYQSWYEWTFHVVAAATLPAPAPVELEKGLAWLSLLLDQKGLAWLSLLLDP